jgi:streptomycin 6-kinase
MERVEERVREWAIVAEDTVETESSFIVFGRQGNLPVVLKVLRQPGDEWLSGKVLESFDAKGTVRVYEHVAGALLLERLEPGTPLSTLSLNGLDAEATEILAEVIRQMSSHKSSMEFVTVEDWGKGFEGYLASGDNQIPADLVQQGQQIYMALCASQKGARLLHGDLHHYNILFDSARGWVTIDPKGVIGEVEYEIGAALRNPYERPELFVSPKTVERRIRCLEDKLKLDAHRALLWGFSQAVLSAIWGVEDGFKVDESNPALMLANAVRQLIE